MSVSVVFFVSALVTILGESVPVREGSVGAEQILRQCYDREMALTQGRVEVSCSFEGDDDSGPLPEGCEFLLEWDSDGRFRLGIPEDDESAICVSDGQECLTGDGTKWDLRFVLENRIPESAIDSLDEAALDALYEARNAFTVYYEWLLYPLSSGKRYPFDVVSRSKGLRIDEALGAELGIEEGSVLMRGPTHRIPSWGGNPASSYSVLYVVDPERALITQRGYYKEEAEIEASWQRAIEVAPGVWMPERMVVHDAGVDMVCQITRATLAPVSASRFQNDRDRVRQTVSWKERTGARSNPANESPLVEFLDHWVEPVLDDLIANPMAGLLIAAGAIGLLVWNRRRLRSPKD